jgi:ABC-type multidrug transport system ATPase subunit
MEEAEALCNRVGIIHKGSLKCVGDIKFLKARFGTGHKVTINVEPTSNAGLLTPLSEVSSRVTEFVTSMLPNAVQEFHSDLYFIFRVPNIGMKLSELFKMMDLQSKRHKYGLAHEDGFTLNWSVNSASLEELFFRIVKPSMLLEQNK